MSRKRRSYITEDILKAVILLLFLGSSSVVGFWNSVPPEGRTFLTIVGAVGVLSGFGAVIAFILYRKQQRALAWQRAMTSWSRSTAAGSAPKNSTARYLSAAELEKFAAQVYKKMGYQVKHTGQSGDHGIDVRLINPKGEVELVQCKQWNKPVGEPEVRDLYGAMLHEKAARGFIWAPSGFSENAKRWVKGKPIVLADEQVIGRLVESAYRTS